MQEEFDIIVIGSGLGGLECGVMLLSLIHI